MKTLSLDEICPEDFLYSAPTASAMGGQFINITHGSDSVMVQTPKCFVPYGVNEFYGKQSVDLHFTRDTPSTARFKAFLEAFDQHNINKAVSCSSEWFKKDLGTEAIADLYRPYLKRAENSNTFIKAKMLSKKGEFLGDIFDRDRKMATMDIIQPGCYVEAIIECIGMYFVAEEFGMTWKVVQLLVHPAEKNEYAFVDDSDNESA